jgi:hypothetical protein
MSEEYGMVIKAKIKNATLQSSVHPFHSFRDGKGIIV